MRITVSRLKILDELYALRDEAEARYAKELEQYEKAMQVYQHSVTVALETAIRDIHQYGILTQEHDEWDSGEGKRCWDWYNAGIRVKVPGPRPKKPEGVSYRVTQAIGMLERSVQDKISIDENHLLAKVLIK